MPSSPAPTPADAGHFDLARLDPDQRQLLSALALGSLHRTRAWVHGLLDRLGARRADGQRFGTDHVRAGMEQLARTGWLSEHPHRAGCWRVHPGAFSAVYLQALQGHDHDTLRAALASAEKLGPTLTGSHGHFPNLEAAVAITQLAAFGGRPPAELHGLRSACSWGMGWDDVLERAVHDPLDELLFARLHPGLQAEVLADRLTVLLTHWQNPGGLPVVALSEALLARARTEPDLAMSCENLGLPLYLAEFMLMAGRFDEVGATLAPMTRPTAWRAPEEAASWQQVAQAMQAVIDFRHGRWDACIAGYDGVLARLRADTGKRKGLLPLALMAPFVLALMARQDPAELQRALKFCLNEGGKRQPVPDTPWGVLALAQQMRLGEARRDPGEFRAVSRVPQLHTLDFWRWLVRAWLTDAGSAPPELGEDQLRAADFLRNRLTQVGLTDLADQLEGALAVLQGRPAPARFFVARSAEGWRHALAALAAIATPEAVRAPAGTTLVTHESRLMWVIDINEQGALRSILPFEQKHGLRGWSKPKAVPLSRIVKTESLPPHDAAVARCIRQSSWDRTLRLDLAAAAVALIEHPCLVFDDLPEVLVTLTEVSPQIDVQDQGDQLLVRLIPAPRWTEDESEEPLPAGLRRLSLSASELKEVDALRTLTLERTEPQRAQLIRLNPAQKRVAQLVGRGLSLPKEAADQLQPVLQGLGAHFQIHSDDAPAGREVPCESRLRAELTPQGAGVTLRLVVAPFGGSGPRLSPGLGRARLITAVDGETLGVQRDLAAERSHLETVLDACPMLTPLPPMAPAAWDLETPDEALALLERLHTLNAVMALDWPKGKPIRVDGVGVAQLRVNVSSGSEWLALQGGITINEQLVTSLDRLLDWSAHQKSRFIPMGEGRFLALTEELRARLEDLASVAQPGKPAARGGEPVTHVPPVAAEWLDRTLAGADVNVDVAFRERIDRLIVAQSVQPALPRTLQAQLRPYQEEGYQWAMRLAATGLGACLADDMGLGKTLQALAVLLARAADGPALVVAPTSLIGNWQAEAHRFAPTLRLLPYAEGDAGGDRAALVRGAGPGDVVLVSYQLQQLDAATFGERAWHTLVLDEAQAIKNASAKRSQAVHELSADFRLALSGTPIENRLSELWSIMRVCNPGLLGSLALFNLRFAVPIERDRNRIAQRTLRRLIAPFILRRTKSQVLDDLPPRTELSLLVEGDATERAHYEALRRQALRDAERAMKSDAPGQAHLNILAQLTRLRRAACDPRLVTPDLRTPGAKVRAFGELAAELTANGHKALVFSQFVDFLALLKEPLDAAGIPYQYLDGSTPAAERTRCVAAFQAGEGELFLISLKAGGFGLNLTVADYVVIADPWWNPAAEDQASGRAHRIGQQRPVTVYRLVHQGTLEEKIVALHQDKRELADSVLEGNEVSGPLQAEELVALMLGD
ncbi:SNF2 family DNA or RNA helicase [Sphaerotilus hippei]|uniref:SNF2 family DNA or RNA helicase n=1 Tax=Sphaerotilus hippei TaxID=744406 RepID=A0A318H450_9BURK|nr:DEAD/DEAH box helicase [Sphaerotilus hippei]PXW98582.1 SNF2 family DNA or RNA helicase [Sphaerotilus hippei]